MNKRKTFDLTPTKNEMVNLNPKISFCPQNGNDDNKSFKEIKQQQLPNYRLEPLAQSVDGHIKKRNQNSITTSCIKQKLGNHQTHNS